MREGFVALLVIASFVASCVIVAKPVLSSSELIEDSWVLKASLPTPRSNLGVAVVNGKIYTIGGMLNYDTNEEYDPATDTWTTKASMPTARYKFCIAVYQNKIYCIGGQFSNNSANARAEQTGAIEVYDPATDTWETRTPMPIPRSQFQANVVNGKIYLIGGRTGGINSTVSVNEIYDPNTGSWVTKASMIYPVVSYSSAVVGNRIYVFGGQDEFNETMNLAVNQIYNAETDSWSLGASLPTPVLNAAAGATSGVLVPQRIYVAGGDPSLGGEHATDLVQVYNPDADNWSYGASMPTARFGLGMTVLDDRLYAIGGANHYSLPGDEPTAANAIYTPIGYPGSIDRKKPVVTVLSPENKTYNSSSVPLVFALNEQATWTGYSLDGEETVTVTGNTTLPKLPNGLHNVIVYANDTFGNMGVSGISSFVVEAQQDPFPTLLVVSVVSVVAVVAVGILVYFKKRKR